VKKPKNLFLSLILFISACDSSEPSKSEEPQYGYGSAMGDMVQCTVNDCQPGSPSLTVNGMSSPRLYADVNQPVSWQVTARSSRFPGRTYAALRMDFNPPMPRLQIRQSLGTVTGADSISVSGQLTQADLQANSVATVVVRDMTACQVMARGANVCSNPSQPSQYDTTLTASISVQNQTYNRYSPYSTIPGGSNMNYSNNNNMDVGTRLGVGAALGALQSLLGGTNGNPTGVLGGALNGAMNGLNANNYSGGYNNIYSGSGFYNNSNGYPSSPYGNSYQQNSYGQPYNSGNSYNPYNSIRGY
jgi:hypothetical protein